MMGSHFSYRDSCTTAMVVKQCLIVQAASDDPALYTRKGDALRYQRGEHHGSRLHPFPIVPDILNFMEMRRLKVEPIVLVSVSFEVDLYKRIDKL